MPAGLAVGRAVLVCHCAIAKDVRTEGVPAAKRSRKPRAVLLPSDIKIKSSMVAAPIDTFGVESRATDPEAVSGKLRVLEAYANERESCPATCPGAIWTLPRSLAN